jgi:dTMP kinase
MKKGKFIVIEGLDGCGKSTICETLQKEHKTILLDALPSSIRKWLKPIGNTELPQATFSYFTLCNILKSKEIERLINEGNNVILDRYYYTTFIYHQELLQEQFPHEITYLYNFLLKPDLLVFLDVPQKIRESRIIKRGSSPQWYGDAVSAKKDLTEAYMSFFKDLNTKLVRVNNHDNSIEQSKQIINTEILELFAAAEKHQE